MNTEKPADPVGWDEDTSRLFIDYGRYFVPERDHQMQIIAALLSYLDGPSVLLELCCGEGLLAEVLLDRFPAFTIHGRDGSVEMLQRSRERLARFGNRFQSSLFDLPSLAWRKPGFTVHAVVSSLAIHHLTEAQKQELFFDVYRMLGDGGVFVVADLVEPINVTGKRLAAETWDEAVRRRSLEIDGNTDAFDFFVRERWNTFGILTPKISISLHPCSISSSGLSRLALSTSMFIGCLPGTLFSAPENRTTHRRVLEPPNQPRGVSAQ